MASRFIVMLLIAGTIFGGLGYAKYRQVQTMVAKFSVPKPPTPVAAVAVGKASWPRTIASTGSLTAVQDSFVTNEVPGIVSALHFDSGQEVAAGALLVSLDATVDLATLEGLQAELELARLQHERAKKLVKDHTLSRADYDEVLAKETRLRAGVTAQQATIAKKTLRAPFTGTLGIRRVDLGDYLAAGSSVVSLQTLSPIYLDSSIPERYIAELKAGQEILLRSQAYGEEHFSGRLTAIEPGADPATRMVRIRAEFSNTDKRLRPGMFVDLELVQATADEVLTLPETAISYSPYGNSVFLITETPEGLVVQRKPVETGGTRGGDVAVTKGLAVGDRVVAVGQNKLRNGMQVEIVEDLTLQTDPP
jgi:membrane fusion protein (multidrug efflux system)